MDESLPSDEFPDFVVQPYQFEPLRNNEYVQQIANNESSSEEDMEEESTNQSSLPTDTSGKLTILNQISFIHVCYLLWLRSRTRPSG